jgi:hypothetical protein
MELNLMKNIYYKILETTIHAVESPIEHAEDTTTRQIEQAQRASM